MNTTLLRLCSNSTLRYNLSSPCHHNYFGRACLTHAPRHVGEEIEVTGIYTHSYDLGLSQKSGFPVFGTLIEANYIQKRQDQFSVHRLTDDDRREILALARDPQVPVGKGGPFWCCLRGVRHPSDVDCPRL